MADGAGMLVWVVQNTLIAALLALLAHAAVRLFSPSPALRHALWLVVLLKLAAPPLVFWPWRPFVTDPVPVPEPTFAAPAPALPVVLDAGEVILLEAGEAPARVERASGGAELATRRLPGLGSLLLSVWALGAAGMASLQLVRLRRLGRCLSAASPAPLEVRREVAEIATRLGVRPPRTIVVPASGSPLLVALGRPTLVLPAPLLERLDGRRRRAVVVHELAHLRRGDPWVGWALLALECAWWWNPLFWHARRQVRESAELACDAWVVWALPEERRPYAETLIEVCRLVSVAAPAPALGMGSGTRRAFERRLTMILNGGFPTRLSSGGLLGLALLAIVALPGWSLSQEGPSDPQEPPPGKEDVSIVIEEKPASPDAGKTTDKAIEKTADKPAPADTAPKKPKDLELRIQSLEKRLDSLLDEVKKIRAGGEPDHFRQLREAQKALVFKQNGKDGPFGKLDIFNADDVKQHPDLFKGGDWLKQQPWLNRESLPKPEKPRTAEIQGYTTVVYKLPSGKGEALAEFLRENVEAELNVLWNGDTLTLSGAHEAQKAIEPLVFLMKGKVVSRTVERRGKRVDTEETKERQ